MPPPTSTEDNVDIAPWLARDSSSPPPKRSNFGFASVKVLTRQANSSSVFTRPRASESTLVESFHSSSTGESSQRSSGSTSNIFKTIKRSLSRPNVGKHSYDAPPQPPPAIAFSHDTSSTNSFYAPPSPPPPTSSRKPRKYQKQKSSSNLAPPSKNGLPGLPDGASMERILNVPVEDIVHPSALEENSYGSLTSTDSASSPTIEDFGSENGWVSHYNYDAAASPPRAPAFINPFPTTSAVSLVSRRKVVPEKSRATQSPALLPVAPELQKSRRMGSAESTAMNDVPASWTAPESWAVPKEGDEPEAPDYTSSEDEEEPQTSTSNSTLLTPQSLTKGNLEGKAPVSLRKGSHAKVDSPVPVSAT